MAGEREHPERTPGTKPERTLEHDAEADREYTTPERTRALDEESRPGRPRAAHEETAEEEEDALRRQAEAGTSPRRG